MRVAFVGGSPGHYDELHITDFLQKLRAKYPDVVIHVGSGKGAEAQVREWAELVGVDTVIPDVDQAYYGAEADLMQVVDVIKEADAIVTMGTTGGARAKLAIEWWHRMNLHRRNERGGLVKPYVSQRERPIPLTSIGIKKKEKK